MRRKIISALLLIYILQSALFSIPAANAGYTCKWFGYGSYDAKYSASYSACDATFEECEKYRLALPTVSACESECWNIDSWNWCESYLEGDDLEKALEADALLVSMEMEDYFMDMRLLSLAADVGAENVESFKKASGKNNILNPSFMTYAIFAGAYGYDRMTKETPWEDEVIGIPGFGEFDEDILMDTDSDDEASGEEDEVEDTEDISSEEPNDEPADKEEVDVADEPETVTETEVEDGRIYNEDFGYSLDVETEHVAKITQLNTDDPFYAGAVVYCYEVSDESYKDWACGDGLIDLLVILPLV